MQDVKHTPGPWAITRSKMLVDGAFDYAIGTDASPVIAEAFGRDSNGGWPNSEANAHLIAAAPEMFEALRECQKALDSIVGPDAIKATSVSHAYAQALAAEVKARAALAKAEGRP